MFWSVQSIIHELRRYFQRYFRRRTNPQRCGNFPAVWVGFQANRSRKLELNALQNRKTTQTSQESFGCTHRSSTFRKPCILHFLNSNSFFFVKKLKIGLHSFPKHSQNFQKTLEKVRSQWGRAPQFGRVAQANSEGPISISSKSRISNRALFHGNQRMGLDFPSKWTQNLLKTLETRQV